MSMRRWFAGLNLAVTFVLLGVLFIFVNFVAQRRYIRADLTRTQLTALSDKTRQIVAQLEEPLRVIVFYQPQHHLYELVRDLLKEYERLSPHLEVEYVDPDQDQARALQLVQRLEIDRPNLVVFEFGLRHKHLSDTELAEYDYAAFGVTGQPGLKAFKAEEAFTSAILGLTQEAQPLVWVTTGHGEKAIDDLEPLGLAELKKRLEQENMQVEAVMLLEHTEIPGGVSALIIPGPTRRFLEAELELLQAYLDGGGRLLVLVDPLAETGLDPLLLRWGADLGQDIVVDPARQLPFVSAANLFVATYNTQHPVVEHMETLMTLFPLARSVYPAATLAEGLTATTLALTSAQGWGERKTDATNFTFDEDTDTEGPVSIALAVERDADSLTRLVVVGDSDFLANSQLPNVGNLDFALGSLHWLVAQEQLIGIGPKPLESIKLNLSAAQMRGIAWLSMAVFPGVFALMGVGMWWVRRR